MNSPEPAKPVPASGLSGLTGGGVKKTPNQLLAVEIVDALVEAGLMAQAKGPEVAKKIAGGQMTQDDWSLLIELATPKPGEVAHG